MAEHWKHAAAELKGDREVVIAAVKRNGRALYYAAADLKGDREVVIAAVTQDVRALEFASPELQEELR